MKLFLLFCLNANRIPNEGALAISQLCKFFQFNFIKVQLLDLMSLYTHVFLFFFSPFSLHFHNDEFWGKWEISFFLFWLFIKSFILHVYICYGIYYLVRLHLCWFYNVGKSNKKVCGIILEMLSNEWKKAEVCSYIYAVQQWHTFLTLIKLMHLWIEEYKRKKKKMSWKFSGLIIKNFFCLSLNQQSCSHVYNMNRI